MTCDIIEPLSSEVYILLGLAPGSTPPNLAQLILERAAAGKKIWGWTERAVIYIGEGLIVKIGGDLDHDEGGAMRFLAERAPSLPAPRCMGLITIGKKSLLFMTKIPGDTLEHRWPTLNAESKVDIQRSLNEAVSILRNIEKPEGQPFGSSSGRCRDLRTQNRYAESPVHDEAAFNEFLLTAAPRSQIWSSYRTRIASMLRTDHRIVFTRGDFHPRNNWWSIPRVGVFACRASSTGRLVDSTPSTGNTSKPSTPVIPGTKAIGGPTSLPLLSDMTPP
jgi:hypothetical protein